MSEASESRNQESRGMSGEREPSPAGVAALTREIKPLLAGRGATLQGAVLGDLVARWLAGHRPDIRGKIFAQHIAGVQELVAFYDRWEACREEWDGSD